MQRLNGKGRIPVPRTWGDLKEVLDQAVNAPALFVDLESAKGLQHYQEARALISTLTQKIWKNPSDEEDIDPLTREQALELLERLEMLGYCTKEYILGKIGKRMRKSIADLLPEQFVEAEREAAQTPSMQLSET